MDFALCPSRGPPRLIRFGVLPDDELIATLDTENNILRINRWLFDQLSEIEQNFVLKTKQREIRITHEHGKVKLAA